MLFESWVDEVGLKKDFGDVLGVVETWCKKNRTKLMVTEYWEGGEPLKGRKFAFAGFDFIRPVGLGVSDIGELIGAVGGGYVVDTEVLRVHIGKAPVGKKAPWFGR